MPSLDLRRILTGLAFMALFASAGIAPERVLAASPGDQDPRLTFNIAAQPMSTALNQLAIQANVQMFFEEATVSGLQAPAVSGAMSTRQALTLLLANTQLEAVQDAGGTYVVRIKHRRAPRAKRRVPAPEAPIEAAAPPPPPLAAAAIPQDGPWMWRVRGVYVDPKNESAPLVTPASAPAALPRDSLHANGLVHPEVDLEYFLTPHLSAELSLAAPRRHEFGVNGAGVAGASSVGHFDWMTDILTLKYDFLSEGPVRPYLGAGLNVTSFWNVSGAPFGLSSTNLGPAAQAGVDFRMGAHWLINIDAKWARVRPELRYDGADVARAQFDPMLYALGVGYRFGGSAAPAPPAPPAAPVAPVARTLIDSDGDGVPDDIDECPNTPHGVAVDAKGCPLDSDGDGVPDYLDKCPGTPAGLKVDVNGCEIEELILKGVNFQTASATLTPDSASVLDGVVAVLRSRPSARAEIHGYTDSVGRDAYNQTLSERRARSVMDYLIDRGIPATGLSAAGFGKSNPIASNATPEGRAQNRRVTLKFNAPVAR